VLFTEASRKQGTGKLDWTVWRGDNAPCAWTYVHQVCSFYFTRQHSRQKLLVSERCLMAAGRALYGQTDLGRM
jgi:hypothetical protein